MALDADDLREISRLLDARFEAMARRERRRRRIGWSLWMLFFIASTAAGLLLTERSLASFSAALEEQRKEVAETTAAYQRELAKSALMQQERKQAEASANYKSNLKQSEFDAGLLRSLIKLYGEQSKLQASLSDENLSDEDLEKNLDAMGGLFNDSLATIMQMALRESDPGHAAMPPAAEADAKTTQKVEALPAP